MPGVLAVCADVETVEEGIHIGGEEDLLMRKNDGARRKRVGDAQFPEIDAGNVQGVVTVISDADELQVIGGVPVQYRGMIVDGGDDQGRGCHIGAVLHLAEGVVEPVETVCQPILHRVDVVGVVVGAVPSRALPGQGLLDDADQTVDDAVHSVEVQGAAPTFHFVPSFIEVATVGVVFIQLVPEIGAGVVAVVELQHVVSRPSHGTEVVAVRQVEVPRRAGAQFAAAVLVEEGALLVDIHVGGELPDNHKVDEGGDVDECGKPGADILVLMVNGRKNRVEVLLDVMALLRGDGLWFRVVIDVIDILPEVVRGGGPGGHVTAGELVGLHDVASAHLGQAGVGAVHRHNVHAIFVNLDFLRQKIESAVVAVDDDLAVAGARRVVPQGAVEVVGETVAQEGGVVVHRVQNPVVLGRHPEEGDVPVGHVIVHSRLEAVGLLVVSLGGGPPQLDADAAHIVQEGGVVLVRQVVAGGVVHIQYLHRGGHLGLVRNRVVLVGARYEVSADDDDGQIGRGEPLCLRGHHPKADAQKKDFFDH